MKFALYSRTSKTDQNLGRQRKALEAWDVEHPEHEVAYFEEQESTRKTRPVHEEILQYLRDGYLKGLVVTSLDRWGRSISELVLFLEEVKARNWRFISLQEGIDMSTATGLLHVHILAAFAEFERGILRERTLQGLANARARGKKLGRHPDKCSCGIHRETVVQTVVMPAGSLTKANPPSYTVLLSVL